MSCPRCGNATTPGALRCASCGTAPNAAAAVATATVNGDRPAAPPPAGVEQYRPVAPAPRPQDAAAAAETPSVTSAPSVAPAPQPLGVTPMAEAQGVAPSPASAERRGRRLPRRGLVLGLVGGIAATTARSQLTTAQGQVGTLERTANDQQDQVRGLMQQKDLVTACASGENAVLHDLAAQNRSAFDRDFSKAIGDCAQVDINVLPTE